MIITQHKLLSSNNMTDYKALYEAQLEENKKLEDKLMKLGMEKVALKKENKKLKEECKENFDESQKWMGLMNGFREKWGTLQEENKKLKEEQEGDFIDEEQVLYDKENDEYKLIVAEGDNWWNYIVTKDDVIYRENKDGREKITKILAQNEDGYARLVDDEEEIDYEADECRILYCSLDLWVGKE